MGWRRRYCPRPVIVAVIVAVCVLYQCLTLLWKSTSWTIKEYTFGSHTTDLRDVATERNCLHQWRNVVKKIKNYEETIKKLVGNAKRRVFLYGHPNINIGESSLYKTVLTQFGYTVLQTGNIEDIKALVKHNQRAHRKDILIYLHSNKSRDTLCKETQELSELPQMEKVNIMPGLQQLLCKKRRICEMSALFPELENLSVCSMQSGESLVWKKSRNHFLPNAGKTKNQDINLSLEALLNMPSHHPTPSSDSPLVRVFVLITSFSPLRAFIHSIAMIQDQANKPFTRIKLQQFHEGFFPPLSHLQAFSVLKEMISKLLLTLEVLSEAAATGTNLLNRCNECVQLLTFDIEYSSSSSPPTVLEVKEQIDFHDLSLEDDVTAEIVLQSVFNFIVQNNSSSILEVLEHLQKHTIRKENICWMDQILNMTREDMDDLYIFMRELTKQRKFEMIYPSTSVALKKFRNDLYSKTNHIKHCGSLLRKHELYTTVLEHLEILNHFILANRGEEDKGHLESYASSGAAGSFSDKSKVMNCSTNNDTLSYIRRIFSNPLLDLTPAFNPKIKDYYVELPFDVVTVEIGAEPAHCESQVHLDDRDGPRSAIYPIGLGSNQISLHVTDNSKPIPKLLKSYRVTVHREDRPSMPVFNNHQICGFVQDCGLIIDEKEPCGLQNISNETMSNILQAWQNQCHSGDAKGQWVVPCLSCSDNRTCDWRAIRWQPHQCHHLVLQRPQLQQCVKDKKILFIGDSTNRGMMYYLIERVNGTLQEWQKTHDMKLLDNINCGRTNISYSYYPQFWIDVKKRPTFEEALENLLERSHPVKDMNQTVLVVGGVQWLNTDHLQIIHNVLKRKNLRNILVIIKSVGMGFHLPVHGIRSLTPMQVRHLSEENTLILNTAKLYGYEVVDTFSITMGRYKEFLRGKCGCHYHEVVKTNKENNIKLLKSYTLGGKNFPVFPDNPSKLKSLYHVHGPVNQVYSEILLSRICA